MATGTIEGNYSEEEEPIFHYAGLGTHKKFFVINEIAMQHLHLARASEMARKASVGSVIISGSSRIHMGLKPLRDMISYVSAFGNYKQITDFTSAASNNYIQYEKFESIKKISRDAERGIADILIKDFFKTSGLLKAAYKVREKGLEYAVILKDDEAEIRGVFSDYIDEVGESLKAMNNIRIHYILPELEEHITYSEKIL